MTSITTSLTESKLDPRWCFDAYRSAIAALPVGVLGRELLLSHTFRLFSHGAVSGYYAPFDGMNDGAKIMLVGVTPGFEQMRVAFEAARDALRSRRADAEALRAAKTTASFAGPMRRNLVSMLDGIGLADALGIDSTAALWGGSAGLLHSTSAVRFPVFVDGDNYTGHRPPLNSFPLFRRFAAEALASECVRARDALIVPLGDAVSGVLAGLVESGAVPSHRCLFGLPHPSGANGHRARQFGERRDALAQAVRRWRIS